jgi:hypothetical protein
VLSEADATKAYGTAGLDTAPRSLNLGIS